MEAGEPQTAREPLVSVIIVSYNVKDLPLDSLAAPHRPQRALPPCAPLGPPQHGPPLRRAGPRDRRRLLRLAAVAANRDREGRLLRPGLLHVLRGHRPLLPAPAGRLEDLLHPLGGGVPGQGCVLLAGSAQAPLPAPQRELDLPPQALRRRAARLRQRPRLGFDLDPLGGAYGLVGTEAGTEAGRHELDLQADRHVLGLVALQQVDVGLVEVDLDVRADHFDDLLERDDHVLAEHALPCHHALPDLALFIGDHLDDVPDLALARPDRPAGPDLAAPLAAPQVPVDRRHLLSLAD